MLLSFPHPCVSVSIRGKKSCQPAKMLAYCGTENGQLRICSALTFPPAHFRTFPTLGFRSPMPPLIFTAMRNPIIVALDVPTAESALQLAAQLAPVVGAFKIGSEL